MEVWRDIPGYAGKYSVSNQGRIKNIDGLIMKPMVCTNGYLTACLWKNNRQKKILIHRLVAEMFLDNWEGYSDVNHLDEDKTNNCVENLEWCTHLYNMNYGSIKKKMSEASKGRVVSEARRQEISRESRGRMWMNNGVIERFVRKDDVPSFLLDGWKKGRKKPNDRKSKPKSC